ncbi:ABC transporter substrate-binding protein [Nocardioides yefusunii]|uniref:ABC transporter substrate-binding protein n=1 Tax=Nocardioides yefusunii TaxID=2500546 RepID=A0ABW1R1Y7_9ACTN|nr:ABC transporter substrate-binding protein [Nocardioides yefusunii]
MKALFVPSAPRRLVAGVGIAAMALLATACGSDSSTDGPVGDPVAGGTVVVGMPSLSDYANPLVATTSSLAWVTDPITDTLYETDGKGGSTPSLAAAEPEISSDGLTWTIKLAEGVKFSNGDAFTADHVAAVINHVADPTAYTDWTSYFAYFVKDAKAVDDTTVEIHLSTPYGVLRSHLENLPIIHSSTLDTNDTTIGTGPFVLGKITQGQSVTLIRNDNYRAEYDGPETIEFRAIPNAGTRLVNLREGKIDVMTDVPASNVTQLEKDKKLDVQVVDSPTSVLTFFNAKKGPFKDVKVRQALAFAMDREGVSELVYNGTATTAQGPAGPALDAYDEALDLYPATPDVEKAKALLAEAGYADGLKFKLSISNSSEATVKMAEALAQGWKKAGIEATIDSTDAGTWAANWVAGEYQLSMTTFVTGVSAGDSSFPLFTSYASTNTLNQGYANAEADTLMNQAWATTDKAERAELTKKVNGILAADAIAVPPVYPSTIVAQRDDVTALDADQLSLGRLDAASLRRLG